MIKGPGNECFPPIPIRFRDVEKSHQIYRNLYSCAKDLSASVQNPVAAHGERFSEAHDEAQCELSDPSCVRWLTKNSPRARVFPDFPNLIYAERRARDSNGRDTPEGGDVDT